MSRSVPLLADADRHLWKKLDLTLRLAIRRLLLRGHVDGPDSTPLPADWTTEKEELFLRISTHARDCRKRATRTRLREMVQLLQGIKATDPRNAEHIKWVLELPGQHLPTEEDPAAFDSMFNRLLADERRDPGLRQSMRESVEKFEGLYAALFPLIGHRVWTPMGTGTLLTVFRGQCEIKQDGSGRNCRVTPSEVYPDEAEFATRS